MKSIYNLLLILCALFSMASCQEENDALGTGGTGYLRLTVNGSSETTTKAANLPAGYTGKQIAVEIVDAEGKSVKSTNDWTEWEGEQIALPAGEYTVKAHSYGFDGKQSAMAAPYYYGSAEVTIENGKEVNQAIVCKLANVKMSVKIADDIKAFIADSPLVAHNAQFDIKVLNASLASWGLDPVMNPYFCTLSLARKVMKGEPSYRLTALAQRFGWEYDAHNALADSEICGKLFKKLCGDALLDEKDAEAFFRSIYKERKGRYPKIPQL